VVEQRQDRRKVIALAVAAASAIAIPAEGLRQFAYYDPPGILTVCYGSTTDVQRGKKYSLEECKARLDKDMLNAINQVERCHPGLPANVLAAFGDAVYNIGPTVACNSTASRMLAAGDIEGACNQLPRWNKAKVMGKLVELPGLTKRRVEERELCLGVI
jgi:GH24 family phage-related lysozyme (muramidase)